MFQNSKYGLSSKITDVLMNFYLLLILLSKTISLGLGPQTEAPTYDP